MTRLPAPDPRHGDRLAAAIEAATGKPAEIALNGDMWEITTAASESQVRPVVEAHDGIPDVVPDPDAEIAAAIDSVDTSQVTDAGTKAALDALRPLSSARQARRRLRPPNRALVRAIRLPASG